MGPSGGASDDAAAEGAAGGFDGRGDGAGVGAAEAGILPIATTSPAVTSSERAICLAAFNMLTPLRGFNVGPTRRRRPRRERDRGFSVDCYIPPKS